MDEGFPLSIARQLVKTNPSVARAPLATTNRKNFLEKDLTFFWIYVIIQIQ